MSSNRYLKVFKTYDEYNEYIQTQIYRTPSVFIIKENEDDENKEIHYQSHDIIINNIREYFTIENIGDYELILYVSHELIDVSAYGNLYYCFKNSDIWQELGENEITIPINESVKFKGVLNKGEVIGRFNIDGDSICKVCGNVMSLVYGNEFVDKIDLSEYQNVFRFLFYDCKQIVNANDLILPATTLADGCYQGMFYGCTNLTTAPELLATTLANYCYYSMFNGCSKLSKITMLATDISASNCLKSWVYRVSSSGTFVKHPLMTTLPSGTEGIPNGWTVENCSVITPSITKSVNNDVVFYYSDGMFTLSSSIIQLYPYYSEEQLLSMQPQCDICVSIYDNNGNELMLDYIWETTKKLEDIMIENNLSNVLNLFINITSIVIPNNNGSYYYL